MTRNPLILAAVAGALALGGCGSGNNPNGGAPSANDQDKAFEGALKFSQCMRQHGVDMPDPKRDANGGISISGPPGGQRTKLGDPKMKAAQSACQKYMDVGGGPPMDPAQQAKLQDAFVAYAGCMRGKGIDMPDPKVTSHGVQMTIQKGQAGGNGHGTSAGPPDSPVFKAADKACHHFLAGVGPKGKGGTAEGPMLNTVKP